MLAEVTRAGAAPFRAMQITPGLTPTSALSFPYPLQVDDLCDSGLTLAEVSRAVAAAGAASVKTLVLLDKIARRKVDIVPNYIGFQVGWGGVGWGGG